ncbi:MAG: phosphatidylglycerophosphatase A [Candidatus Dependentiae bacterium]|jgi:hypothetical protein
MTHNLHNLAYFIASLGPAGKLPAARIWGSALGVPLLLVIYGIGRWAPGLAFLLFAGLVGGMLLVSTYARRGLDEEQEGAIILDRLAGVMIALVWLPQLTAKFVLFGFAVFHMWLFISVLAQRVYAHDNKTVSNNVILCSSEIALVAILSNLVLQFVWWVAH